MIINRWIFRAALVVAAGFTHSALAADDTVQEKKVQNATVKSVVNDEAKPQEKQVIVSVTQDGVGKEKKQVVTIANAFAKIAGGKESPKAEVTVEVVADEPPAKIWLGIGLKEIEGDLAAYLGTQEGIFVESVFPNSPAEAAKLQAGDVVLAFNGEKISDPMVVAALMRKLSDKVDDGSDNEKDEDKAKEDTGKAKKEVNYPKVTLKLLRRGKESEVEITPEKRPQNVEMSANLNVQASGDADIEKVLKQLHSEGGAHVFQFGDPATVKGLMVPKSDKQEMRNVVVVVKRDGGESMEITIERQNDNPAKITVKEGEKTREIGEKDVDQLPEKVRQHVTEALKKLEAAKVEKNKESGSKTDKQEWRFEFDQARKDLADEALTQLQGNKALHLELRKIADGHAFAIVGPDRAAATAEALASKYTKLAQELAQRGAKNAKDFSSMPEQLQQLCGKVDELKKQIEELQAQIKDK